MEGRGIRSTASLSVYERSRPGRRLGYRETYRIGCNSRQRTGTNPGRLLKDTADYVVYEKGSKKKILFLHFLSSSTDHSSDSVTVFLLKIFSLILFRLFGKINKSPNIPACPQRSFSSSVYGTSCRVFSSRGFTEGPAQAPPLIP